MIYLYSFLALFELYCFIFLQRVCTDVVEIFTKSNMVAHHDCVKNLVSEVTFRKVESMLQVT